MPRTREGLCAALAVVVSVTCCLLVTSLLPVTRAWELTLVHSGDTFGAVVAVNVANNPCMPVNDTYTSDLPLCLGGVARRTALIRQIRQQGGHTMVLDLGNVLPGANYFLFTPQTVTRYAQEAAYDVIKLGLYDMQGGVTTLRDFIVAVQANGTQVVSSNLKGVQNETRLNGVTIHQKAVIDFVDGERVGFAGTMPSNIGQLVTDAGTMDSTEEIEALQIAVGILLNEGVNKIIAAVSNAQIVNLLVERVLGIDVVLVQGQYYSNNDNTGTPVGPYPTVRQMAWNQKVCIAGVGVWDKHLGRMKLEFDENGVILNCSGEAIPLDDSILPVASIQSSVAADYNVSMSSLGRLIGSTLVPLDNNDRCMFGECGIGSWAAELVREAGQSEIGFVNGGGLGDPINTGDITLGEFIRAYPFPADQLVTLRLAGSTILAVLEHSVSLANDTSLDISQGIGRFLQFSGLRFTWNPSEEVGMRVVNAWTQTSTSKRADAPLQWALVDPVREYTVATNSYIASGQDGYTVLAANAINPVVSAVTVRSVLLDGFDQGPVTTVNSQLIVRSTASRRSCFPPGSTDICNSNGYCLDGACICTVQGAEGQYCDTNMAGSSSSDTLAIVLGVILPLFFVTVVIAILIAVVILGYMKYKRPKLILKEPNYQLLVWRRDSMESATEARMLPMRRLSVKVQSVLEEFLMDKHVAQAIANVAHATPSSIDEVSAAMMLVYQSADKGIDLIRLLLKNELMALDDDKVLFREETCAVKAFSVFSRMVGLPYLWNTFALPIAEIELANNTHSQKSPRTGVSDSDPAPFGNIFSPTGSTEINPKMMEEGQDNFIGRLQLELILQKLFSRITESINYFPLYLRQVCHLVYEDMRYDHPDYIHRVLGNLIFLRFICPALIVPHTYGLTKSETQPKTHRTLVLIAKVLQNLANKNDFTGKEQYMEVMNGFIHRNLSKLEDFFNQLCKEADEPRFGDPPTSIVPRQFRKKSLALMYQFIRNHGKAIHQELSEFPSYAVEESLERLKYILRDTHDIISDSDKDLGDSESDDDEEGTR